MRNSTKMYFLYFLPIVLKAFEIGIKLLNLVENIFVILEMDHGTVKISFWS